MIAIGGHTVSFTGLEPIDFDVAGGAFTVSPPNANNVVTIADGTLTDGTTPALKISGTSGGTAFDDIRVRNSAIMIDTTNAAGNDTINIASADNAHGNTSLQVKAGMQSGDVINVNGTTTFSGTVTLDAATINLNADVTGAVTGSTATTVNVAATAPASRCRQSGRQRRYTEYRRGQLHRRCRRHVKDPYAGSRSGTGAGESYRQFEIGPERHAGDPDQRHNPATQYDNFVVTNTATLGNSTLNVLPAGLHSLRRAI